MFNIFLFLGIQWIFISKIRSLLWIGAKGYSTPAGKRDSRDPGRSNAEEAARRSPAGKRVGRSGNQLIHYSIRKKWLIDIPVTIRKTPSNCPCGNYSGFLGEMESITRLDGFQ